MSIDDQNVQLSELDMTVKDLTSQLDIVNKVYSHSGSVLCSVL